MAARRAAAAVLVGALLLPPAAGQAGEGAEGPLRNDAFLPVSRAAAELLARGDSALEPLGDPALLVLDEVEARRAATTALESWFAALEGPPGTPVPVELEGLVSEARVRWLDPDASAGRRAESVEIAVLRRLSASSAALRQLWRERIGPGADAALSGARGRPRALESVEARHPGTRAAALAALRRAELALESGRPTVARAWLERAGQHAAVAGADDVRAALEPRRAVAATLESGARPARAWDRANRLAEPVTVRLSTTGPRVLGRRPPVAGLVHLDDGRLAVQVGETVWLVDEGGAVRGFEPARFASGMGLSAPDLTSGRGPGWVHAPRTDGETLYLVVGRAGQRIPESSGPLAPPGERTWQSNMVCALRPPQDVELPALAWALGPAEWTAPDGASTPLEELLEPGMWEFQPGPALTGSLLLVQARRFPLGDQTPPAPAAPTEARVHLLALDRSTGAIVWQRFLGRGTDVVPEVELRFNRQDLVRTPAQPLAVAGTRAFVGTALGIGAVVDLADGRLVTSFLNRRRRGDEPGWVGHGAPPVIAGEPPHVLWAPPDSDHLYALRLGGELDGRGWLERPPTPIGEGVELVGGDGERVFVLGRAGARHTLSAHELATGRRYDSVWFGRGETPIEGALLGARRAAVATDHGLYLFDLGRELYLEQHLPLELDPRLSVGGLVALDGELALLAGRTLLRYSPAGR